MQTIAEAAKSILSGSTGHTSNSDFSLLRRRVYDNEREHYNSREGVAKAGGFYCERCRNKGYVMETRDRGNNNYENVLVPCPCETTVMVHRNLAKSGIAGVSARCRFDNFKATEDWQKSVYSTAFEYASEVEPKWFFFGGQSGAGKTHLCTAICSRLIERGCELRYMLWREDIRKIKCAINDEYCPIEEFKQVEVLYIDDMFKIGAVEAQTSQRPTQADINIAFEIINHRALSGKRTIISSECFLDEIIEIDEALGGRIKELCGEKYCLNIQRDKSKNFRLK